MPKDNIQNMNFSLLQCARKFKAAIAGGTKLYQYLPFCRGDKGEACVDGVAEVMWYEQCTTSGVVPMKVGRFGAGRTFILEDFQDLVSVSEGEHD